MRKGHYPDHDDTTVSWRTLKSLIPYLLEFKLRVSLAIGCLIAAKLASVGLPFILKSIVDHLDQNNTALVAVSLPLALLVTYGALRLGNVLLGEIRDTLFGRVTERAMRRLGLTVFKHLHSLELDFHLNRRTGGLSRDIERGTNGVSFLLRFMVFNIGPTVLEISLVVILFFINYDALFAIITLSSVIIYVLWSVKATEWRTRFVRAANEADSKSNTRAIDSLLNYETVKYFNNEKHEAQNYDNDLESWESARRSNRLTLFALNGGQAFIIAVAMSSMMILAAYKITTKEMTLGDFVLINAFMMQIFMPLNFLGFVYREMKGSLANIEKMFVLLRRMPKVQDKRAAKELLIESGSIEFRNVSFHYQEERPIIKHLSLKIPAGKKVAFVGTSGAGKSTLMKLLYRFYDVSEGQILIDGQSISEVTQSSLRKHIAIVPQDTVLFNDTIWNNIQYGRIQATNEDVQKAIKMAHLEHFIQQLPKGAETMVGERGLKLSGGEKQRVAIARAIIKNSPILLFDEATSSLDSQSEQSILNAMNEVAFGHTSIVIAHRLSTIVDAETIFVLDDGEIVEQGTHKELLALKKHYATLWEIQKKKKFNVESV